MTTQYDKLKAARGAGGAKPEEPQREQRATPAEITAEQERMEAGEPVGGQRAESPEPPAPPDPDDDDDDAGETAPVEPGTETVSVRAHERAKPATPAPAPPGTEAIELDGKTVYVAPELAAAFRESTATQADAAKTAERDALVNDVVARVADRLPPAAPAKSDAELAAERALAEADAAPAHPMPDAQLQISDPDKFATQLKAHINEEAGRASKRAIAEQRQQDAEAARETARANESRAETVAREQLALQFFDTFKVLSDAAHRPLVDILLNKKWDEIRDYVRTQPFKTQAEGLAFKKKCFADVAADATRQIVAIRHAGTAAPATPAPPPPTVASSRPAAQRKPPEPPARPVEKFPTGSLSALLSKHKAGKTGKGVTAS